MPTLAQLSTVLTKRLTLFAETPDEAAHITYRPGAFHSGTMDEWNALSEQLNAATTDADAHAALEGFGGLLCRIIAEWDLLEADGVTVMPLTAARLAEALVASPLLFVPFMQTLVQAIAEDMTAGKASGTPRFENSDAISSLMAKSASPSGASRNRSGSSSSRAGSTARPRSNGSSRTRSGS